MKYLIHQQLLLRIGILLTLGMGACQSPEPRLEDSKDPSIKILEVTEVDSVVADFPVGFKFLTKDDWQFVAYYNKDRYLSVASRKANDPKWTYQTLPSKVGWDSHNRITMAIDRSNCLHLSGNMHNDTLVYFKTKHPLDISSFQRVFPMVKMQDELRCTYPKFIKNGKGELIFTYRKGGSGNGINLTNLYDDTTESFKRLTDQPLFDGQGLMSAYASGPSLGPDSWFHIIWFWRDTPACETNHDLSYSRSQDLVNWQNLDGQKIELPITPNTSLTTVDPVPPGGGVINGGATLFFNTANDPLIAYMKYDSAGKSQIYLANPIKGRWNSTQISNWNYRWAFSGPGSIDFEIKLKKPYIRTDDKIIVPYYHLKKGHGELVVDEKTLVPLEDKATSPTENKDYPVELLNPSSGIDSASVRWLKRPIGNNDTQQYYALRWETMGKRRFYKAPATPVKPSAMNLYLLEKK